jgi:hypothetical protein
MPGNYAQSRLPVDRIEGLTSRINRPKLDIGVSVLFA